MKVYLVLAHYAYEGSSVFKAFASQVDANAFAEKARKHSEARPVPPEDLNDHAAWDLFDKIEEEWRRKMPDLPGFADDFLVFEIEVQPKEKPSEEG